MKWLIPGVVGLVVAYLFIAFVPQTVVEEAVWSEDPLGHYYKFEPSFGARKLEVSFESRDGTTFDIQSYDGKWYRNVTTLDFVAEVSSGKSHQMRILPVDRASPGNKFGFAIKVQKYFRFG